MTEKVLTLFDKKTKQIAGIVIVEEIELGYISDKIVLYLKQGLESIISPVLDTVVQASVNIPFLIKRVAMWLKTTAETENIIFLEPYTLASDNKNKSSRNKRMIEQLNLPYQLERSCVYYGKKSS
jgi:hypothetical protein